MRILVTGSEGMVGRHLVWELKKRGHKVIGIDKKEDHKLWSYQSSDITREKINLVNKCDIIVHLAATCSTTKGLDDPSEAMNDNTMGCFEIAELAREYNIPVIYTSSIKAKPNESGQRTPYGLTKYMGELIFEEWGLTYGVKYIINRPGTIYGPFQDASAESGWLGWFIKAAVERQPIDIYGDGHQIRDVLFVDDYVRLLVDQVEYFNSYELESKLYEVGGGQDNAITILKAVEHLGINNFTFRDKREGDALKYVALNIEAGRPNGWKPQVDWKKGIQITKDYFSRRANS